MSQKLDPREVLLYLNELGYTNVTAQQLKEFLTDLKKLIKYENRHRKSPRYDTLQSRLSNENGEEYSVDSRMVTPESKHLMSESSQKQEYDNIFHSLHNHHTVSSRTRTNNAREKHISVHITKPRHTKIHDHCIHVDKTRQTSTTVDCSESNPELPKKNVSSKTDIETATADTLDQPDSKQSATTIKSENKSKKSRSSVIRSSSSKAFSKCDPVTLYHKYKEEWKKIKFPGQDHHSDLRWAVHEKLMGGPRVQVPLKRSSSRKNFSNFN